MTPSTPRSILPPLSPDEETHSARVAELIRAEVAAAGGWLCFDRFMELALYAPGLGYYSAGSAKLGAGGDFVTAPEMSDLFSRCVARQCAEVLAQTGGEILELGAGTGRMAAVILTELAARDALPQRYAILEVSADLAARQRARLAALPPALAARLEWLERLPEGRLDGVILANEVLDALPFRRFALADGVLHELGVALSPAGGLRDAAAAPDPDLAQSLSQLASQVSLPAAGYFSEVCLRISPWIASLGDCLARGVVLLSDYGLPRAHYYHRERRSGTLRCHFRQRAHDDPYLNLGLQDITAWVDFTRVAEAAAAANLSVAGFATQTAFLLGLGLPELVGEAAPGSALHVRLAGEARRLLMPEEMGEAFKVMALARDFDARLSGFTLQDLRGSL
jgi:SAM-dependent MidA family methyltransferase